jgi:hypothetical protein
MHISFYIKQIPEFVKDMLLKIKREGVLCEKMHVDHICLRTTSDDIYEISKKQLINKGYMLL